MATTTTRKPATTAPLHSDPAIAKALAARDTDKYSSMEAWGKAHKLTKAQRRQARQVLRDNGQGVGRGRRYSGATTGTVRKAAQANAKRAAQAKAKASA